MKRNPQCLWQYDKETIPCPWTIIVWTPSTAVPDCYSVVDRFLNHTKDLPRSWDRIDDTESFCWPWRRIRDRGALAPRAPSWRVDTADLRTCNAEEGIRQAPNPSIIFIVPSQVYAPEGQLETRRRGHFNNVQSLFRTPYTGTDRTRCLQHSTYKYARIDHASVRGKMAGCSKGTVPERILFTLYPIPYNAQGCFYCRCDTFLFCFCIALVTPQLSGLSLVSTVYFIPSLPPVYAFLGYLLHIGDHPSRRLADLRRTIF